MDSRTIVTLAGSDMLGPLHVVQAPQGDFVTVFHACPSSSVSGSYREDEVAVVERQRLAAELANEIPGGVFMNQSNNAANAGGYSDFVRGAISQAGGSIDAYVGCVGTGGSMTASFSQD